MNADERTSEKLNILYAILVVALVVTSVGVWWSDHFREWRSLQTSFNEQEAQRTRAKIEEVKKAGADEKALKNLNKRLKSTQTRKVEIKQVMVPGTRRVDRCMTCHLGMQNPLFAKAQQPFSNHPGAFLKDHPVAEFGCTLCHLGQGMATTSVAAHGNVKHWFEPMLTKDYAQASCNKCHPFNRGVATLASFVGGRKLYSRGLDLDQAPVLSEGRKLFEERGCWACHGDEQLHARSRDKPGPELTRIGEKVTRAWVDRWLREPRAYLPAARMPNPKIPAADRAALMEYLFSLSRPAAPVYGEIPVPDGIDGKKLFDESQCVSCHAVNGKGGRIGVDLGRIGNKVRGLWLVSWLKEPHDYYPRTQMPRFRFTDDEARALARYLMTTFRDEALAAEDQKFDKTHVPNPELAAKGKVVFSEGACAKCHVVEGAPSKGEICPDLTGFADKTPDELDFGKTTINKSLVDWTYLKMKDPRAFGDALKMPDFNLTDAEATALTTLLLSYNAEPPERKFVHKLGSVKHFVPLGKGGKLLEELKCLTCHRINDTGGDIGPDLTKAGSRLKLDWLREFLRSPTMIRPELGHRMPNLRLTDEEIEALVRYFQVSLVDDAVIEAPLTEAERIELAPKGKELFDEYQCPLCHRIGTEGDEVGPNLDKVGSRIREGWMVAFIQAPLDFFPDIEMPDLGLSDDEIKALTAYLQGLR